MARVKRVATRRRTRSNRAQAISDSEDEKIEETETVTETETKSDEKIEETETVTETKSDEKIEETQTEEIPDENKSDPSTDSEEKARRKKVEIAKGKKPMPIVDKKRKKEIEYDKFMFALGMGSTKGVVIGGEPKNPETVTETETKALVRPKITVKRSRSRRAFAVRSTYSLRSGLKGIGLDDDVSTEFDQTVDRKRKERENVADDLETDLEQVCKKMKPDRDNNDDDDKDGNDSNGDGGLAQKNLTSVVETAI